MKKLLLFLFISIYFNLFSQVNLDLNNNLTGILSNSTNSQIGLSYNGTNSITKRKYSLDLNTNYSLTFSPKISENELVQRVSLDYKNNNFFYFIPYQFNYSYNRKINSDNWIGIGYGYRKEIKSGKFSLSYAIFHQNTNFYSSESITVFRHSIKGKLKIEKEKFEISTEYYYQPNIEDFNDVIIYGTTQINIFPKNKLNFTIQDVVNYRNQSTTKLIHNLTLGIGYKISKEIKKGDI